MALTNQSSILLTIQDNMVEHPSDWGGVIPTPQIFGPVDASAYGNHDVVVATTSLRTDNPNEEDYVDGWTLMFLEDCDWAPVAYNPTNRALQYYNNGEWTTILTPSGSD